MNGRSADRRYSFRDCDRKAARPRTAERMDLVIARGFVIWHVMVTHRVVLAVLLHRMVCSTPSLKWHRGRSYDSNAHDHWQKPAPEAECRVYATSSHSFRYLDATADSIVLDQGG